MWSSTRSNERTAFLTYRGTDQVLAAAMGVTGLLPALQVQAETGARYLKKACGSAVGVDLVGWLHEYAAHDYRSVVLEGNHAPVVKAVMEAARSYCFGSESGSESESRSGSAGILYDFPTVQKFSIQATISLQHASRAMQARRPLAGVASA